MFAVIFREDAFNLKFIGNVSRFVFEKIGDVSASRNIVRRRFDFDDFNYRINDFIAPVCKIFEQFLRTHSFFIACETYEKNEIISNFRFQIFVYFVCFAGKSFLIYADVCNSVLRGVFAGFFFGFENFFDIVFKHFDFAVDHHSHHRTRHHSFVCRAKIKQTDF